MNHRIWHICNCSLFEQLALDDIKQLEDVSRVKKFQKGSLIYLGAPNQFVYLLVDGRIRIGTCTTEGKQAVIGWIEPGEIFGELSLIDDGPAEEQAETMINSTIVQIPACVVKDLMAKLPQLAIGLTKLVGLRRVRIERRLRSLLFRSNKERLGNLILELAESYGRKHELGVMLQIKLSHQELASIIGTTRECVTLILGEMQSDGLVKVFRQRLLITDIAKLAAMLNASVPMIAELSRKEMQSNRFHIPRTTDS